MGAAVEKRTRRQIRRSIGVEMATLTEFNEVRLRIALGVLRAGFWGRLRWVLFGLPRVDVGYRSEVD